MIASSPIIVYLLLRVVRANDDYAYCAVRYSRLCQEKGQHVGCQYPDPGPGESCEKYTRIAFTEDLKNFILNYINRRRQKIAAGHEKVRGGLPIPKPDIMMYVEWDRELAYLAQRLADQCRFVHDECRATVRYPYAGQTVGEVRWRRSHDSDQITAQNAIRKVFDAWWGEKRRVQPQQLTTPFRVTPKGTVWGHFSQLAIWKLRAIGCGAVHHGPPTGACYSSIKYPIKFQDLDSLYDYENQDSRDLNEETLLGENDRVSTDTTEDDGYREKLQDIDANDMSRHIHKKITTTEEGLDSNFKRRNQLKILYGRYEPPKSTTKRVSEVAEYEDRKYAEYVRGNDRHRGHYYEKRPHATEDYSVIPLRSRPWDRGNDLESPPWRPKLYWRTSTTVSPEYETSIVMQTIRRQHKENRRPPFQIKVREKETAQPYRKPLAPSLMLDKDDIDQLFKDTGFKPNWTPSV